MDKRDIVRTSLRLVPRSPRQRLVKRILPWLAAGGSYVTPCGPVRMEIDFTEMIARRLFALGLIERPIYYMLKRLLKPGMTMFDVGANIGFFTMLSAHMVGPTGRVVAFEPDPKNVRRIKRTMQHNPTAHVTVEAAAVSDGPGELEFQLGRHDSVGSLLFDASYSTGEAIKVPTLALDDYLRDHQISRVDVMKMDIEGAEIMALEGMERGLAEGRYGHILIEWHGTKQHGLDARRLKALDLLRDNGYELLYIGKIRGLARVLPGRNLRPLTSEDIEDRVRVFCRARGAVA